MNKEKLLIKYVDLRNDVCETLYTYKELEKKASEEQDETYSLYYDNKVISLTNQVHLLDEVINDLNNLK